MPRRLIVLNVALALVALAAVAYVVRELRAPAPTPRAARRPATTTAPAVTTAPADDRTPTGAYGVVAARNLFSPTRSDTPAPLAGAQAPVAKPNLYGVLLSDANPVAYLEDPVTKRVAGYRLGDTVAGGTVKLITADYVVLNRPDGDINVRLRDASKPRPAAPPVPGQPGATTAPPPVAGSPGAPRPVGTPPTMPVPPQPAPVITTPQPPGAPAILPRRPLPPNLIRRLPPTGTDAPAQN
jgi:hypothetical protein